MLRHKIATLILIVLSPLASALTFNVQPNSDLVGNVQSYVVSKGDSYAEIARKFDIGILELLDANPKVNGHKAPVIGSSLVIPTQFILPNTPHEGLVINLAELRVYYYPPNTNTVMTFPLGIGREGWRTPVGQTTIVLKRENPVWIPPDSIKDEAEENGHELPDVVPAGPNNPLGKYAMNLGIGGIRMHGTNAPATVGLRASHGCMRMYPEDIESLFKQTELGTKVTILYDPIKVGVDSGQLYLESHRAFDDADAYGIDQSPSDMLAEEIGTINYAPRANINWNAAQELLKENFGYPKLITNIK